ncbi:unnamed protein product [Cyclocybe aegerita]|uniref:Uncharacterized protein n=1 Tax=Cyclocybe aegerita TaxID=1973307 RepID=A0A8S0VRH7_CYCAE|nr:unnamed protein product [Cyclocybe aegerita]
MPFRSPTSSPSPSGSGSWSSSTLTATQGLSSSQTSPRPPFSFSLPPPIPDHIPQSSQSTRRAPSAASTIRLNHSSGGLAADATSSQLGLNSSTDNDTSTTTNVMDGNANGYITPDTSISATLAPMTSSGSSAPLSLSHSPSRPLPRSKSKSRRHSTAKDRPVSTHTRASTYVAPAHDVQFRLLRRSGASNSSFLMVTSYLSGIQERANTLKEMNRKRTKLKKKRPEGWVSEKEREAMKKELKVEKSVEVEKRISTMPKLKEEQEMDANTNVKEDGMERWMGMVTGKKEKGKGKAKEGVSRAKSESDARRESTLTSRTDINTTNAPVLPTPKAKPITAEKETRKPIILDTPSPSRSNTVTSHGKSAKGKGKARRGRCSSTMRPASTVTNGQKPRSRSVFSGYLNHLLSSFPRLARLRLRASTTKSSTQPPAYPRPAKGPSTPNMLLRGRHFTEKYIPRFPSRQFLSGVHTLQAEVQSQSGHGHPDTAGPPGRSSTYNVGPSGAGSGSARVQEKPRSRLSEQGHERASSSGHEKLSSHGHGRSQSYSAYPTSSSPATSKTYVNGYATEQTQAYTSASSAILSVPAPARSRPSSYSPPYFPPRDGSKSSVGFNNVGASADNKQAKEADAELSQVGHASSSTDHSVSTSHSPPSSRHGHGRSRSHYYGQSSSSSSTSTAALSYATAQSSTAALSYTESQSAAHAHSRPLSG